MNRGSRQRKRGNLPFIFSSFSLGHSFFFAQLFMHRTHTRLGLAFLLFFCASAAQPLRAQYCTIGLGGSSGTSSIDSVRILGTTLDNWSPGSAPGNYTAYPATANTTATLVQGQTYVLQTAFGFSSAIASLWIDYNQNFLFESTEWTQITTNGTAASVFFTVPAGATTGNTGLRIRTRDAGNSNGAFDACSGFGSGETEDYTITIAASTPCSGTPVITGVTPTGPLGICGGGSVTLFVNAGPFSGYTYAWQQSTDGGITWTATSATAQVAVFNPTAASTEYRVIVTCTASSASDTSTPVVVTLATPTYAAVPYVQDFESWSSLCATADIPGNEWRNVPATGVNSWRRDDQGSTAAWPSPFFGSYFPSSYSGNYSARFHSAEVSNGDAGALDLYLDCSAQTGDKQLYFYHVNEDFNGEDSLEVQLSTDGGATFTSLARFDTATQWTLRTLPIPSNSATTVVRLRGTLAGFFDFTDIGVDSLFVAPPCTGAPTAGTLTPGPAVTGCPGSTVTFSLQGATLAGNLQYTWQTAASCSAPVWTNIAGANGPTYTTQALTDTAAFRVIITCTGSGLSDTSDAACVEVEAPVYATLPYVQDFESWITRCEPTDIPDESWTSFPSTGDFAWRRYDQGLSANWWTTSGGYAPPAFTGSYSARFHSYFSSGTGRLDLLVDASAPGGKELQFHYINFNDPFFADGMTVQLSTDGGATFSPLATLDTSLNGTWELITLPFTSTSAATVLRFEAATNFDGTDLGMDNLKVLLPCSGTPTAGTVNPLTPCAGRNFQLTLSGNTQAAGLSYQWQQSTNGTTWTAVPGGAQQVATGNISTPTYFRAIVTCTGSSVSDTTAAVLFNLAPPLQCYCESAPAPGSADDDDIGNFRIAELPSLAITYSNGTATPLQNNTGAVNSYSPFNTFTADTLFKGEDHRFSVTQITGNPFFNPSAVAIFIDLNRDGDFDPLTEQVGTGSTSGASQTANINVTIPTTADTGLTGLRVILASGTWQQPQPCGDYFGGETEDYIVYLAFPRCDGTPNAGVAAASDTALCIGETIDLQATGYSQELSGLALYWESATDPAGPWTLLPGSEGQGRLRRDSSPIRRTTASRRRAVTAASRATATSLKST